MSKLIDSIKEYAKSDPNRFILDTGTTRGGRLLRCSSCILRGDMCLIGRDKPKVTKGGDIYIYCAHYPLFEKVINRVIKKNRIQEKAIFLIIP